jgi:uroporphyrinogen-III synthase
MQTATLKGRLIAIPEAREIDVFAAMLERRGASVLRCPLVSIRDAPDHTAVLHWIRRFNAGECHDLILLTGEGLQRLLGCIDRHAPELRESFLAQLAHVRKITRGPKPAKALRELGLKTDIEAPAPTTDGIIESLRQQSLAGRSVGVQLYGAEPNRTLVSFLENAGAQVLAVAPYVYADAADDQVVLQLLTKMRDGQVDAIAFTSSSQITRIFSVAAEDAVRAALQQTAVAAVGPIVADTLKKRGIDVRFMPTGSFFMKPLTRALEDALGPAR